MGIDSVRVGEIGKLYVQEGDFVKTDQVVYDVETEKVNVEVKAPESGVIKKLYFKQGDKVDEGALIFELEAGAVQAKASTKKEEKPEPKKEAEVKKDEPKKEAAKPEPKKETETKKEAPKTEAKKEEKPHGTPFERVDSRQSMKPIRVRIATRLKESQNTYAMLTTFNEIDMHELMQMRTRLGEEFLKKHNVKLGFMSAFVKSASQALKNFPIVNSVIDGNDIIHRNYHDISVAVASPRGLVVPVLRNVQSMSFADIELTLNELSTKAKDNKISVEDMAGGTFTISNGGVFGSLYGTPIINPPQSAILGMHAINKKAHVVNDEIKIRPIMVVALTYDHRIIDGREAVLFLKTIKQCLEDPHRMLLDL